MNIKSFINNLRAPKRPNVDIIGIAKETLTGDFTREQKEAIESFPIDKMTLDEKILLTQSLSTFNTEYSKLEAPSDAFSGRFRYKMLDKLLNSDDSEKLVSIISKSESEYSSDMIPFFVGKYSTNTDMLNSVMNMDLLDSRGHRFGITENKNAPSEAIRYAYDYLKDNASKGGPGLDPLENVTNPVAGLAKNPNVPLDVLVDIIDDFGHMTGIYSNACRVASDALNERFQPKFMSTESALDELSFLEYDVSKDGDEFIVTPKDSNEDGPVHVKLVGDKVVGLDELLVSAYQPMSAVVYNNYNDNLNREIDNIRDNKKAVADVELSFDGLDSQPIL